MTTESTNKLTEKHVLTITVKELPTHVETSKSRRRKYYRKKDKIPKKYQTGEYEFYKNFLRHKKTKQKVISNPRSHGTPSRFKINGQHLWNQGIHYATRNKVKKELAKVFEPLIPDIKYEVVSLHFYLFSPEQGFDLDNKAIFYQKAFQDALVYKGFIPDDDVKNIKHFSWTYTYDPDAKNQSLIIGIDPCQ